MKKTPEELKEAARAPKWLLTTSHMVEYDPQSEHPHFVRLLGAYQPRFDRRDRSNRLDPTRDAIGFGKTLKQAAKQAKWNQNLQFILRSWTLLKRCPLIQ